jgi:hypothetical protein
MASGKTARLRPSWAFIRALLVARPRLSSQPRDVTVENEPAGAHRVQMRHDTAASVAHFGIWNGTGQASA